MRWRRGDVLTGLVGQVLMEAVFQECFEREITKAERNANNKASCCALQVRLLCLSLCVAGQGQDVDLQRGL